VSAAPATLDLTALGTTDWAHWGKGKKYPGFNHDASGNSLISTVMSVGAGGKYSVTSAKSRGVTWTNGTPMAATKALDTSYITDKGAINSGFRFTVAASTTPQTLVVYAGGNNAEATLLAHLSDGSAADVQITSSGASLFSNVYTITYSAASAGQTLTLTCLKTGNMGKAANGSVDVVAAYLV
jgi:hypothetical protein